MHGLKEKTRAYLMLKYEAEKHNKSKPLRADPDLLQGAGAVLNELPD